MTPIRLNNEQQRAVEHIEGPMMVLAGPGTGKTQIIAARIRTILETTQMDPHNILCLTFTESGVVAMRKRLLELIGTAAYHVRIHTFHSFCNDVIKDFPEKFLFARELESLTDIERVQIIQSVLDQQPSNGPITPFGAPYLYQNDALRSIQQLKRENISADAFEAVLTKIRSFLGQHGASIEAVIETHGNKLTAEDLEGLQTLLADSPLDHLQEDVAALDKKGRTKYKNEIKAAYLDLNNQLERQSALAGVYRAYQAELKKRGRYDYEDMILFVVDQFQQDPELLARYQEQFQYILVDEYQDTNGAQNRVVQLIGEFFESPNVFVVGDDKQSIYRFQGASLENILYFYKRYQGDIELVALQENYRSQQTVLDAAHSLIEHNEHGVTQFIPELSQTLRAATSRQPAKLQLHAFDTPQTEHYFLAKKVQELIQKGVSPSEIAILYRNNWDVQDVMELFLRLDIPFRLEAGIDILEDPKINQLIRLLRLVQDLDNAHDLFYVLHFDFLDFDTLEVSRLMRQANKERQPLFEVMLQHDAFKAFAERCLSWKSMSVNRPLMECFDHIVKESGYLDHILALPDKVEHLNRLNTLFDEIKTMNRANHALTLEHFLETLDLLKENNISIKEHELQTRKDAVRLMTAHKSKGLEFEHVFIMKCVDKHWGNNTRRDKIKLPHGLLQNDVSADRAKSNEDERRLFYVAITRAKQQVYFSYAKHNNTGRPQVPSLFLAEIAPESIEEIDTSNLEEEALQRLQTVFLKAPEPDHREEEAAFVRSLLENYRMSVTHLNNYLRCPRLFYYNNLLRVPRAKSKHESFGSAVHEALKDFSLEHKKGALPDKAFLLEQFEHHMKRQVMTEQEFRGGLEFGRDTLADYYDHHKSSFHPDVLPEFDFSSHGVNLNGIALTGKLDKIELIDTAAKTVHVVDYKTGNPDSKRQAIGPDGDYRRQIIFYKLLCDLSPRFPYTMVSGEIDFIQKSKKKDTFTPWKHTVTAQEVQQLKTTIQDVYEDIMNLKFLHPDEWSTCGECEYCEFFSVKQ